MTSPENDVELDPDLAAALAEDDDEPPKAFDTTDEEEAMDPAKREALDEVRREVQQPRRIGRPKGSRTKKRSIAEEPVVPQGMASANAAPPVVKRPIDMQSIWEGILERLKDRGLGGPEMVTIGVTQISIGPNREEPKHLNSIPGEAVGGSRTRTPGEDLQDYIERGIHVPGATGPAKYRLMFRLRGVARGGDANLGVAEVTLPSAADIRKRWEAVAQLQRDKERENDFGPMPRQSYRLPQPRANESYGEAPPLGGGYPAPAPQMIPPAAPPQSDFANQMLDRVWDMYERERRLAQRLGEAPPPAPDPRLYGPPPAAMQQQLTKADVASAVVETLQALGVIPKPGAQPAPPPAPTLTTPVVATAVTAPMNAAKEFFTQMREFKKMEADMREMFAPEEEEDPPAPPAPAVATVLADVQPDDRALNPINEQFARYDGDPIMYGKQADGESTMQWLARLAMGNPKISGALLEKGAKMLDASSFGKLVSAFTSMGGPQAQAARNLPPVDAQQPQHPQANGAAFKPNIG